MKCQDPSRRSRRLSADNSAILSPGNSDVHGRTGMRLALAIIVAATLAGCAEQQKKEELEASKNTYVCLLEGDRLVIKFEFGMARMLMPGGERIDLYQIPAPSGIRYSNGNLELRGK